jgi:hypothetical protein
VRCLSPYGFLDGFGRLCEAGNCGRLGFTPRSASCSFILQTALTREVRVAMRNLITILTGTNCGTIGASQIRNVIAGLVTHGLRVVSSLRFYAGVRRCAVSYAPVSSGADRAVAVRARLALKHQALGLLGAGQGWRSMGAGSARSSEQ